MTSATTKQTAATLATMTSIMSVKTTTTLSFKKRYREQCSSSLSSSALFSSLPLSLSFPISWTTTTTRTTHPMIPNGPNNQQQQYENIQQQQHNVRYFTYTRPNWFSRPKMIVCAPRNVQYRTFVVVDNDKSNTTTTNSNDNISDNCSKKSLDKQQTPQLDKNDDNSSTQQNTTTTTTTTTTKAERTIQVKKEFIQSLMGESLQPSAGRLWKRNNINNNNNNSTASNNLISVPTDNDNYSNNDTRNDFIPQVSVFGVLDSRRRKRVLILCTGGTLCMAPDPTKNMALAPVQGALSEYMKNMHEIQNTNSNDNTTIPDIVLHEYTPFYDSSDLGPADWIRVANDIRANYLDFDGFVVLTGTDTMAYFASALSFIFENLGKPIVFTGSQIPLCYPYNDGRRNLIMALLFASRNDPELYEVTIYFHNRLLRANRTTKVNTHSLHAFDSPNFNPLATIGININDNQHLYLPPPKGQLRIHPHMDTRILTLRLIPGFDDGMIRAIIQHSTSNNTNTKQLQALIIQLYGTGNLPSVKQSLIQLLGDAVSNNILVVATTQCYSGSVIFGQYAVGNALIDAGVISAHDMTIESISCKIGYLFGRCDLNFSQIQQLISINLRGEITVPTTSITPTTTTKDNRNGNGRHQQSQPFFTTTY